MLKALVWPSDNHNMRIHKLALGDFERYAWSICLWEQVESRTRQRKSVARH